MSTVAIIGGGPAGIVAARYLLSEGLTPTIYERADRLGGQWSGDAECSGVWPAMRTNTSRVMTAFSDMSHPPGTAVYPTNQQVGAYLQRYAKAFGVLPHVRLGVQVRRVERDPRNERWVVEFVDAEEMPGEEHHTHVILASGRYQKPAMPDVPGLATFSGAGGLSHTFGYKRPERYQGQRVLVLGCAISALEIAGDLAMLGASRVVLANRRQRYVLPKLVAGVPTDHLVFTRFGALADAVFPMEQIASRLKQFVTRSGGSPDQFGAPKPADNIFEAGVALSQYFLPLVAEGRIGVKPWLRDVAGGTVRFTDGTEESFDAIVMGTGYHLDLPWLGDAVRHTLKADAHHIDLHAFTFHPDLPGFACMGLFHQVGPYFPVLELQARWIAYVWSGAIPAPPVEVQRAGVAASHQRRAIPLPAVMHTTALLFARGAGVEPDPARWPDLTRALYFGPLTPISFRLSGRDSLPDAGRRVLEDAALFGAIPSPELTAEQRMQLEALAAARKDDAFSEFVRRLPVQSA